MSSIDASRSEKNTEKMKSKIYSKTTAQEIEPNTFFEQNSPNTTWFDHKHISLSKDMQGEDAPVRGHLVKAGWSFDLILVDISEKIVEAWKVAFKDLPDVKCVQSRFENLPEFDCMVSAANSFGLMDVSSC